MEPVRLVAVTREEAGACSRRLSEVASGSGALQDGLPREEAEIRELMAH
jgi:hypothetical protein